MAVLWLAGGLAVGVMGTWVFEYMLHQWHPMRRRFIDDHVRWRGYHLHHSTYGLVAWAVSLVCWLSGRPTFGLALFGLGCGIVAQHTRSERRVVFWDKS